MTDRTRARQLAAEYNQKGQPTAWFEQLYQEAEAGKSIVPWADMVPNPHLLRFWRETPQDVTGKTALAVGCGFGDDAEQLVSWGFRTTAFDISPTAIASARKRFPESPVEYQTADLLAPPEHWTNQFAFVFECYTLQVLPKGLRVKAMRNLVEFLGPDGKLLVVARGREESEPEGQMPWPLTRDELHYFEKLGLREVSFKDYFDPDDASTRRFRAFYEVA